MKKGYLFISNDSKGTREQELSIEPIKTGSFEAPCIYAANKLGYKLYKGVNRINADKIKCVDYDISYYYQHIYRSIWNVKDIWIGYKNLCGFLDSHPDVDVIHCNTPIGGVLGRICGNKYNKKVIYTAHGFHFYEGAPLINRTLFKWIEQWLAHYTDALITINKEDYKSAQKFHFKKGGKAYYVPGVGVNTSAFENISVDINEKKKEIGLPQDTKVGIIVGDLNDNKNVETLLSAVSDTPDNFHVIICGIGPNEDKLKGQADSLGILNRVHFLGFRKDMKELLRISDVFLFASKREGLPRSIMEAMACGLPCVVSNIRGNVDLIDDKRGGFLVHSKDSKGYGKSINILLNNPGMSQSMGKYNLIKAKKYDLQEVGEIMINLYKEVIG